ncbi:MAG: isoquinoline 1-oxidoreductase subunit beta IorB, molybdoprotein [Frankiales bacterium]|nr:isoquinoline 1-oxidoreductase subunit beta IorB, molybdoprotein [Frankiales bacterium]
MSADITRRALLRGGGGLVVAFVVAPSLSPGSAWAAGTPGLRAVPTPVVGADVSYLVLLPGRIAVHAGKVELGTGVQTALTQMVLEELRLPWQPVTYVQGDTVLTHNEGFTAGSKTLQNAGPAMRLAAATAFHELERLAAAWFGLPADQLTAADGRFRAKGGQVVKTGKGNKHLVTYDELLATIDTVLPVARPASGAVTGIVRDPSEYTVVGTSAARVDLPGKLDGTFTYVADVRVPGMLHGRVLRPSGRNARFLSFVPGSVEAATARVPGFVGAYRLGDFVGVVGTSEWAAVQASSPTATNPDAVRVTWQAGQPLVPQADLPAVLRAPTHRYATFAGDALNTGDVDAALLRPGALTHGASYDTPFQMHGGMGASAAVADVRKDSSGAITGVDVWSSTQGVYPLRSALAQLLGVPDAVVRVRYVEASGCYGQSGADDVAADAALLSSLAGRPVRVQWTRAVEHGWEPLGGAMAHDLQGAVEGGVVTAWKHVLHTPVHNSRPSATAGSVTAGVLIGKRPAALSPNPVNSAARNAPVTYAFPNRRLTTHLVRTFQSDSAFGAAAVASTPVTYVLPRTTALRSLGGFSNSFANESFLDELAHAAGLDPLQVRADALRHDPRALAVVEALRPAWASRPAAAGHGAGLGYQQYEVENAYAAAYVEVTVDPATGAVRVLRVVVAHDCGLIVNPDGLRNQIEGNVVQGVSRTLKEEVLYTGDRVTSTAWESNAFNPSPQYTPIRFDEVPTIECILLDRPHEPLWGAGEPAIGCLGGAIGNAVFAATGKRVRRLPMTPARVLATPVGAA